MIVHAAWPAQYKHEFDNQLLASVRYDGIKVCVMTPGGSCSRSTVTGTINANPIDVR